MSQESERVNKLDRLHQLSNAAHHAARVLENLRLLRGALPSKGFEDMLRDVDDLNATAQCVSYHVADSVAMTVRDFLGTLPHARS